ncbi:MAG: MoaD/ThiS family protein [Dehalococcoidia bacterium]|jgi:molybdopterin converting factor small subunit|nr:MoaD/ThiS family protein [Dehalococcoidia bacterium]
MQVKILTFANLKEYSNDFTIEIEGKESIALSIIKQKIIAEKPALEKFMNNIAFAVNQTYSKNDNQEINDLDEIALIPPVAGG